MKARHRHYSLCMELLKHLSDDKPEAFFGLAKNLTMMIKHN